MNIGIFVNSKTGNTLSVAEKLRERLLALGHTVALERVVASNDGEMDINKIVISNPPSTQGYDLLVFAAPVNGFRLAFAMQAYLRLAFARRQTAGWFSSRRHSHSPGWAVTVPQRHGKLVNCQRRYISATGVVNWRSPRTRILIAKTIENIVAICK